MKERDKAPAFTLPNQDGKKIKLSDYKGKWVVLYFYPRDLTPSCTIEAVDFSAYKMEFEKLGAVILGVSKDSAKSHCKFIDKKDLTITLLSDEKHIVMQSYGVWRPKKFMGQEFLGTVRSTFLIDPKGSIAKVWDPVKSTGHAKEVLDVLRIKTG